MSAIYYGGLRFDVLRDAAEELVAYPQAREDDFGFFSCLTLEQEGLHLVIDRGIPIAVTLKD